MTATVAPYKFIPPRVNSEDAKQKIWTSLKDVLDKVLIMRNQILVVKFSPEKVGSLYRSDKGKEEDRWQGKVGLVVKTGIMAFVDDDSTKFHGETVEPGQWVWYRASDGFDVDLTPSGWSGERIPCRVLEEAHIKGTLQEPDLIY